MITVALAAMAYVWFTGVFETITEGAGDAATGTATTIATSFSVASAAIDADSDALVYVTNTGSAEMVIANINVFINNTLGNTTSSISGDLTPGATVTLTVDNDSGDAQGQVACNEPVKVTYSSLEQVTTIEC